ncbi:MAG: hypothetical protein SVY10_15485 [Thermodesulfobacteriota bacterium]|nr:hypothetical protein [Thermodesulfobacteriota bacterium]
MDERGEVSFGALVATSQILNLKREKIQNLLVHEIPAAVLMMAAQKMRGPISYNSKDHSGPDYRRLFRVDVEKKRFVGISDWIKPMMK